MGASCANHVPLFEVEVILSWAGTSVGMTSAAPSWGDFQNKVGMAACRCYRGTAEWDDLLPGSVPLEGKETRVGKDKWGMETGKTCSQEGGQDPWANFCGDSYFERSRLNLCLARFLLLWTPGCPGLFKVKAPLLLPTFMENLPWASPVWVPWGLKRWSLLSGSSQVLRKQDMQSLPARRLWGGTACL